MLVNHDQAGITLLPVRSRTVAPGGLTVAAFPIRDSAVTQNERLVLFAAAPVPSITRTLVNAITGSVCLR